MKKTRTSGPLRLRKTENLAELRAPATSPKTSVASACRRTGFSLRRSTSDIAREVGLALKAAGEARQAPIVVDISLQPMPLLVFALPGGAPGKFRLGAPQAQCRLSLSSLVLRDRPPACAPRARRCRKPWCAARARLRCAWRRFSDPAERHGLHRRRYRLRPAPTRGS